MNAPLSPSANVLPLRRPGQPLSPDLPESQPGPGRDLWPCIPAALDDYGLSSTEFRVYCRIARRAGITERKRTGFCNEKLDNLAKACHLAKATVRLTLLVLIDCGLVVKEKRHGRPDFYRPTHPSMWASSSYLETARQAGRRKIWRLKEPRDLTASDTRREHAATHVENTPATHTENTEGIPLEVIPLRCVSPAHTPFEFSKKEKPKPNPALRLYREVCGGTLNQTQRSLITENVTSETIWRTVLSQFMAEGQPTRRVDWLIERYQKQVSIEEIRSDYEDTLQEVAAGTRKAVSGPVEPPFTSAEFTAAWSEFERARQEVGNPITPEKTPSVYRTFAGLSEREAVNVLRHLLQDGWGSKIDHGNCTARTCIGCGNEIGNDQKYARRNRTTLTDEGASCEITEEHAHLLCLSLAGGGK